MAKSSGLGANLYVEGVDLSNDVGVIDALENIRGMLGMTGIDKSGPERIHGHQSGRIAFTGFFNDDTSQSHLTLRAPPAADVIATVFKTAAIGEPAASLTGKQVNYPVTRPADGSIGVGTEIVSNGDQLNWGLVLTAGGKRTDTGATAGAGVDFGTTWHAVTITSSSVANPTNILCAAVHGLVTGDSIVIAGHTGSTPALDGIHTVTVVDTLNFTIPVNVTVAGANGTCTKTSLSFGLVAYLHVFSFTGTSCTVTIHESDDDAATDAYAAVVGGAFTAATAVGAERIETTLVLKVERWLKAVTTGVFNPCTFAVMAKRYVSASRER